MTKIIKYLFLLVFLIIGTTHSFAQKQDSVSAEILEILTLLEEYERDEIVMHARSQRDIPEEEELTWLLSTMSDSARARVLVYIQRKAGSRIKPKKGTASIYWLESSHDFGRISQTRAVNHKFEFENIGNVAYTIKEVEGSCGCTIADYSASEIPPGGKGYILVQFKPQGKLGKNTEFVTVVGNSQPEHVSLIIEADVY
jgi:hypothetical protein